MKPRLLILLLICAPLLTACYRQTEEPFQQVDSAEVASVLTPTSLQDVIEGGEDLSVAEEDASAETRQYVTPETVPGQVEQPTLELRTESPIAATSPSLTVTPFARATSTPVFEEELDPDHECVYTVQSGDNLFRLSLAWGVTVQEIMDASRIDDDALSIGQLLLRPDCDYATPGARPTVEPQPAAGEPTAAVEDADSDPQAVEDADGDPEAADETPAADEAPEVKITATPIPSIHVVSAGETIESISLKYRVDVNQLVSLNNLTNANQLSVGQELLLSE